MSIYSDKLAHVQVVLNCPYSVAQLCSRENTLAHNLGVLYFDDAMSYNSIAQLCSSEDTLAHNLGALYIDGVVNYSSKP